MNFELVWFDSLGAKSSCCLLESGKTLVIDPGIAVMQPSFPASLAKKLYWLAQGKRAVLAALKRADAVIISHYHYDHFIPDPGLYRGKLLIAKDPNKWINDSQRKRAEEFYSGFPGFRLGRAERVECEDPLKKLKLARKKRFGRYQPRRQDLLKKGLKWFQERCRRWNRYQKIEVPGVVWGDGKSFRIGRMKVRLTQPLFHGIEFARVGWVFSVVVESKGFKFLHSSDLDGPIIEDYAEWIIEENPNVLVLDGPATYLIPYMLNLINLRRAVENLKEIVSRTDTELIILDHHLTRERLFRKRLKEVYQLAEKKHKQVLTAAEYLGKKPKCLENGPAGI